jgi:prepilin-type N-terminal cleavage/methylation domain-containing protein
MKCNFKTSSGFTLMEIVTVLLVIAILASLAIPNYRGYVAEAKAAELLIKIHHITLAYLDSSYDDIPTRSITYYDSSRFGKAPEAFSDKEYLYNTDNGMQLASYVMSTSKLFSGLVQQSTPVVFVHAGDQNNREILYALNHVLKVDHAFVNPDTLAIPLSMKVATLSQTGLPTHNTPVDSLVNNGTPQKTDTTPKNTDQGASKPGSTDSGAASSSNSNSNNTGSSNANSGNTNSDTADSSTAGSGSGNQDSSKSGSTISSNTGVASSSGSAASENQIRPECYRHPGWLKHHLHGC